MSVETVSANTLDIGKVVRETLAVVRTDLKPLAVISGWLCVLPSALVALVSPSDPAGFGAGRPLELIPALLSVIMAIALIRAVSARLNGEAPDVGASIRQGLTLFLPGLGVSLLVGLGVVVGLVLLVVPGVFVALMWAVALQVLVLERRGVLASMSRSAVLTKGNRLRILGLGLIYLGVALVLMLVIGVLAAVSAWFGEVLASPLVVGVLSVLGAAGATVLYGELQRLTSAAD